MKTSTRRKLDMAVRVRDFGRTHPYTNTGYIAALDRLTERIVRAEALAQQQIAGQRAVTGAITARQRLREEIADSLALLAGLVASAAREEPDLAAGIARPDSSASNPAFLTRARVAAATADSRTELLQRFGMSPTFVAELGAMLDDFEKTLNEKNAGRVAHTGARAELDAVTSEIMGLVQQLDALNQFRFRNDAEALAAWRSARNVAWPMAERGDTRPDDGKVQPAA